MTFWGAAMFQWVNAKGWVMVIGTITAYAAIASFPWNIAIQVALSLFLGALSCTAWALFGTALRPVLTSQRPSAPSISSWRCCCWPRSTRSSWTHDAAPRHAEGGFP